MENAERTKEEAVDPRQKNGDCDSWKMKKATDPLGERARTRLCGGGGRDLWLAAGYGSSSGSEHEAHSDCLSGLVYGFMEPDDDSTAGTEVEETDSASSDSDISDADSSVLIEKIFRSTSQYDDQLRTTLLSLISEISNAAGSNIGDRAAVCRTVMTRLRELGLNSGVCKAKWERSKDVAAGSYEYVHVLLPEVDRRFIIDVDFAGEFEITRPSRQYARFLASLPPVLVGSPEELRQIILIGSEAAKKSLKARGLHVPPWRKLRYMQAKWLGPYRRTSNPVPANSTNSETAPLPVNRRNVVLRRLRRQKMPSTVHLLRSVPGFPALNLLAPPARP